MGSQKTSNGQGISHYWLLWIGLLFASIAGILILKSFYGVKSAFPMIAVGIYTLIAWSLGVVAVFREGGKLVDYLYRRHKHDFQDMTRVKIRDPFALNNIHVLKFLRSKENFGDLVVDKLKGNYLNTRTLMWFVIGSTPFLFLLASRDY